MPSKISDAGRALIATKLAASETVDITRVKFGNVAHPDPNNPPVPTGAETDVGTIVHTVNGGITAGYINPDQVAYTAFLDAAVGDFDITQVGFFHVDGPSETLVMIANVPPVRKTAGASNNYKHTETLSIQEASTATGVTIPAATWQLDHTARFLTAEGEIKFAAARLLGRFAALDGALLVSEIAPVLREDCEALTGWAGSSGALALDAVDKTQGTNSVEISGHLAAATLTKTLGAAQDWSALNGVLVDVLSDLASNIEFFIEDSLGNRSFWNLVSQVAFFEHEIVPASPDGNNGTAADLSDVLKFGLQGLDNAVVYNIDNIRTARFNDFTIAVGDAFLEGIGRTFPVTTHAAHLNDYNSDVSAPPVLAPPGAGTRNDKVWLDIRIEGNGSTVAVRAKLTVDTAPQADYVDGAGIQHRVEELAAILRTTSQRITAGMITDSRRDITLAAVGALQSRDERGRVNGYASLDGAGGVPDGEIPGGIQRTSEKGAPNGYADLDASVLVPRNRIPFRQNLAINGGCVVAQRVTALTLGAGHVGIANRAFGALDRISGFTTTTATVGTLAQATAAPAGTTGKAAHFSGASLPAGGKLHFLYRMEAKDAEILKGGKVSISVKVYHDVGSAKNVTLYLRDPNAADDFSATTAIADSGPNSVLDITETEIKWEGVDLSGDNPERGLELEIELDCGSITTKNFYLTELNIVLGEKSVLFEARPFAMVLELCQRYYCKTYDLDVAPGSVDNNGTLYVLSNSTSVNATLMNWRYPVQMRTNPTVTPYSPGSGTSGKMRDVAGIDRNAEGADIGDLGCHIRNTVTVTNATRHFVHSTAEAEL